MTPVRKPNGHGLALVIILSDTWFVPSPSGDTGPGLGKHLHKSLGQLGGNLSININLVFSGCLSN